MITEDIFDVDIDANYFHVRDNYLTILSVLTNTDNIIDCVYGYCWIVEY